MSYFSPLCELQLSISQNIPCFVGVRESQMRLTVKETFFLSFFPNLESLLKSETQCGKAQNFDFIKTS